LTGESKIHILNDLRTCVKMPRFGLKFCLLQTLDAHLTEETLSQRQKGVPPLSQKAIPLIAWLRNRA
jgi:hypothetical protein